MNYKLKQRGNFINKKTIILVAVACLMVSIGVGYAYIRTTLSIGGTISLIDITESGTIKSVGENYSGEFWAYKDEITKIIFQNKLESKTGNNIESWDLSALEDESVMAYYEKDETTLYIQADDVIHANVDSSYLFYGFENVESIEGMEYLDTTNVIDMSYMFSGMTNLANIDLGSRFNIDNVEANTNAFATGNSNIKIKAPSDSVKQFIVDNSNNTLKYSTNFED